MSFTRTDLDRLDALLERASAVVTMREIAAGAPATVIGMRHDVDDNHDSFQTAVRMAEWEAERGYRSTFYLLHTASYWQAPGFREGIDRIAAGGHEIGFHLNSLAAALRTGCDPLKITGLAISDLRAYGHPVTGVVAHGDELCRYAGFVNDELFTESERPRYGAPDRDITFGGVTVKITPVPRSTFGFEYDPNWLPRARYLSDSGGKWSDPFRAVADGFPFAGQLHMLVHSDWWAEAFAVEAVAA